jgi:transcription elongation factor Elf1
MSGDKIEVTFDCPKCHGTVIELPDVYTDDSIAKCKGCGGSFGRYGDIKARAQKVAADAAQKMMRDAFKGMKGFKIK